MFSLGQRQEGVGADQAAGWVLPAHQGLRADDRARREVQLGLVVHDELLGVDGHPELLERLQPVPRVADLRPVEDAVAELAALGGVHRVVGLLQQDRRRRPVDGRQGDADAGVDVHGHAIQDERLAQGGVDLVRHPARCGGVCPAKQHPELVAARPGELPTALEGLLQPRPDEPEQLVPNGVTEAVINLLEAVQVDQQEGVRLDVRFDAPDALERLQEVTTVRQPGQLVGTGLQPGLGELTHLTETQCHAGQCPQDRRAGQQGHQRRRRGVLKAAGHEQVRHRHRRPREEAVPTRPLRPLQLVDLEQPGPLAGGGDNVQQSPAVSEQQTG